MKFKYDPESGALYVRLREGVVDDTLELAEGAYIDIDAEGNVLGAEFLSMEEFRETMERYGGGVELPDHIEDPSTFHLNPA